MQTHWQLFFIWNEISQNSQLVHTISPKLPMVAAINVLIKDTNYTLLFV